MRRLIWFTATVFLLLAAALPGWSQQTWQWQNPLPQGSSLSDITFADALHGWAVGEGGTIIHTSDGGTTWTSQCSDTTDNLISVCFVDTTEGWVLSERGAIRWTMDGGITWNAQYTGSYMMEMTKVIFTEECNGWLLGHSSFHTTDCGAHWTWTILPGWWSRPDAQFLNTQTGWLLLPDSIARTTDGGESWMQYPILAGGRLQSMDFLDAYHGWVVGADSNGYFKMFRTSDGGVTWDSLPSPFSPYSSSSSSKVKFHDADHGWILGNDYGSTSLLRTTDGGQTWSRSDSPIPYAFTFLDNQVGWAVGDGGTMLRTTDAGVIWTQINHSISSASLTDVAFANDRIGCAVSGSEYNSGTTTILRTTDGGAVWQEAYSFYGGQLFGLSLKPSGNGWTAGSNGIILHTSDFGATWGEQVCPVSASLLDIAFADDQLGLAVGGGTVDQRAAGLILRTTNGGNNWAIVRADSNIGYSNICILNAQRMWISGDSGTVLNSTDSGASWVNHPLSPDNQCYNLQAVGFTDNNRGWVCGWGFCGWDMETFIAEQTYDGGATWVPWDYIFSQMNFVDGQHGWAAGWDGVLRTSDGGESWVRDNVPTSWYALSSVSFPDLHHGWAVGYSGTILSYNDMPEVAPPTARGSSVPASYSLAAYPNPFNPTTTLELRVPLNGRVQLCVYDVLGRQVESVVERVMAAGDYRMPFDASRLPSGIYFARVRAGDFAVTKKLLLLR